MKIKNIFMIALAAFLIFSMVSCTGTGDDTTASDGESTTEGVFAPDLSDLRDKMIADLGAADAINVESDMLLDLYGIVAADVAESACYMTMDGVFPQEIVMIKAVDEAAAGRVAAALENRISEVKTQSQNYDPENYALAQKCKVATKDVYVTMFLSPHFDEMTAMFNGAN